MTPVKGGSISNLSAYLSSNRTILQGIGNPEDLGALAYGTNPDPQAKAIAATFELVRDAIVQQLWRREIFVGTSAMDEILFFSISESSSDPVLKALEFLRDRRVTRPGFVLFPLHSIGVLGAGLGGVGARPQAQIVQSDWGVAISAQSNSIEKTIDFLDLVRDGFNIHKPIDPELIKHWHRSRAPWLERNPMIAIRMTTQRGSYYDAEALVLSRVRTATAQMAMVATFQESDPDRPSYLFSSSRLSNRETLDIHHYIVLSGSATGGPQLEGDCVPILGRRFPIIELTDLGIEIDPSHKGNKKLTTTIDTSLSSVYRGYLINMWPKQKDIRSRTNARFFESLAYFLRSFHNEGQSWSAAVSLATAFEMILTDHYSRGVSNRLVRRLKLVLKGVSGTRHFQSEFEKLYAARSDLVHAGSPTQGVDIKACQQAFVLAFCIMAPRIASLSLNSQSPTLDLTGDTPAP